MQGFAHEAAHGAEADSGDEDPEPETEEGVPSEGEGNKT